MNLQQQITHSIHSIEYKLQEAKELNTDQNPINLSILKMLEEMKDLMKNVNDFVFQNISSNESKQFEEDKQNEINQINELKETNEIKQEMKEEIQQNQLEEMKETIQINEIKEESKQMKIINKEIKSHQSMKQKANNQHQRKYSLIDYTSNELKNEIPKRLKTKEILGTIGQMIGYDYVSLHSFCKINSSMKNDRDRIKYLCEEVAPFVILFTMLDGNVIGFYFNKKMKLNENNSYHLQNKGMCIFGSHFENGNIVIDKYQPTDKAYFEIKINPEQNNYFKMKFHGVGSYPSYGYKHIVGSLSYFKIYSKDNSSDYFKDSSLSKIFNEHVLYSHFLTIHIAVFRNQSFQFENQQSLSTVSLSNSFKQIVMKSKPKKTLQQYEQTIMKSQFESVTKIKNTISKTPMMTTIPHDTRIVKLSSHWINVLRTKEIMTRIMNEYQLNQNIQFFGLYHFTEYTIPQNTESINDLLKYGYHSMLCYFVSFDCLIGVAFTKDLSTGLKDIYDYPFEHLKLFSIILKDHQFEFKSYRTINKQEN